MIIDIFQEECSVPECKSPNPPNQPDITRCWLRSADSVIIVRFTIELCSLHVCIIINIYIIITPVFYKHDINYQCSWHISFFNVQSNEHDIILYCIRYYCPDTYCVVCFVSADRSAEKSQPYLDLNGLQFHVMSILFNANYLNCNIGVK